MMKFVAAFAALIALVVVGYSLFLWLIVNVLQGEAVYGLLFVAAVAGVASFFNPCAFPLLPAFLAHRSEGVGGKSGMLKAGLAAALGVATFNLLLGALVGVLGIGFGASLAISQDSPNVVVQWLRGSVGTILIYLGFSHATRKGNPLKWLNRYFHRAPKIRETAGPFAAFFGYGFGYPLLGIGCGGPILAGLSVYAISRGGLGDVLIAFATYALVMTLLMIVVAMLGMFSREALLQGLRHSAVTIQRVSGMLMILVGLFLLASSIFLPTFTQIFFP